MMNKFKLVDCNKSKDDDKTHLVSLISEFRNELKLYFPLPESKARIIRAVLLKTEETEEEMQIQDFESEQLDLYATMIDSWKLGDKIVSGVVLDITEVPDKNPILLTSIILVLPDGRLDLFLKTEFSDGMVVAAFEDLPVYITEELLSILFENDPDKAQNKTKEPKANSTNEDSDILDLARQIIESGKTNKKQKRNPDPEDFEEKEIESEQEDERD